MYKLVFFVPANHAEDVKRAVFDAGAGKIGNYDHCCWQTAGQGQFRALAGAKPFIGSQGQTEYVEEYRIELVCKDSSIKEAVSAMIAAHPYEEPAYDVLKLESF